MKSPVYLINKRYNGLRKSEKRVAEFVQKHMDKVVLLSIQGLADKCGTSDATVLRFCRSLGYRTFSDFKTALVPELLRSGQSVSLDMTRKKDPSNIKEIFLHNLNLQTDSTVKNIDFETIKIIAQQLIKANRIIVIGMGGSAGIAHILSDALVGLGIYATYLHDRSIIQNIIPTLTTSDVVIGVSHSGETDEVVSGVKIAHEYGSITIALTNFSPSPLADSSQYVLLTSIPDNLMGSYSCQSRILQLALLELVLIALKIEITGNVSKSNEKYKFEDVAVLADLSL